jgi:hypothetical protein
MPLEARISDPPPSLSMHRFACTYFLPLLLCQATCCSGLIPHYGCSSFSPSAHPYYISLQKETAPSQNGPICAYTNTSAPSSSSAIALTSDVISAIIHPEDSLRTSIPYTVDVFLPAKVSHCSVSIVLSFSDLHFSPPEKH